MSTLWSFRESVAITKSDSNPVTCHALYVGGTGNLAIKHNAEATAVIFLGVPAGTVLHLQLDRGRVMSTDTTATGIVALKRY